MKDGASSAVCGHGFLRASVLLLMIFIVDASYALAQKPVIDNNSYQRWEELKQYNISNDAQYIWYSYESSAGGSFLVCSSSDGFMRRVFPGGRNGAFTADSKYLLFGSTSGVGVLNLRRQSITYLKDATDFVVPQGNGEWVLFIMKDYLLLRNLRTGKETVCANGKYGIFNAQGTAVWIVEELGISYVDLVKNTRQSIYKNEHVAQVCLSDTGNDIAFLSKKDGKLRLVSYSLKSNAVSILVDSSSKGMSNDYVIADESISFSKDGKHVFFSRQKIRNGLQQDQGLATGKVWVWHYKDKYLQTDFSNGKEYSLFLKPFLSSVPTAGGAVMALEDSNRVVQSTPGARYAITSTVANHAEAYIDPALSPIYQLLSLQDGRTKTLIPHPEKAISVQLSPSERFVTWKDTSTQQLFCYEIESGEIRDLTRSVSKDNFRANKGRRISWYPNVIGWTQGDEFLLMNDRYDIWQVDPEGNSPDINLTDAYGAKHKVAFRMAESQRQLAASKKGDRLLVSALVDSSRYNGFFTIKLSTRSSLHELLKPGSYVYYFPGIFDHPAPIRAKEGYVYLLQRQSDKHSPNLFLIRSDGSSRVLSDIAPERRYNWLTAELHHWKAPDGETRSGVLYKPENFDPRKKYPVIFHFYEMRSNECYKYRRPGLSLGVLDIPWYVSNGYLVFLPDIWQQTGYAGKSALHSVESAARYLASNYEWIDAGKMGLQGHSFGGFEANYIATHSRLFAAAQSSAGISNLTRYYTDIAFGGRGITWMMEVGVFNMGSTPWQRPDLYIENSPFFAADSISTPLLLAHGKADDAVPWQNSLDFFIALRRSGKPAWLLTYEDEGHLFGSLDCARDFTLRQQQFFNHYLKDSLPPIWMLEREVR